MPAPLPAPVNPMPMSGSPYNSGLGQLPYLRSSPAPRPVVPINPIPMGGTSYGLGLGQLPYLNTIPGQVPGQIMAVPVVPNPNIPGLSQSPFPTTPPGQVPGQVMPIPVVPNPNTPGFGQSPFPATPQPPLPGQVTPIPVVPNPNTPGFGQVPFFQPALQPWPPAPNSNLNRPTSPPGNSTAQSTGRPLLPSTALTPASLRFQGSFVTQGENSVARARLDGNYVLTPQFLFGATLDLTSENDQLVDSPNEGATINQLFFTAAPASTLPTLRFSVGQLDLTSYFDRNSFAKDGVSHFFNPVFQTNPALSATAIASRPGLLVNWAVTDNIEGKVALFSSAESLERFDLNGLAGEIGLRYDNVIVRGTYASGRDGGANSGFREIFSIERGRDDFGINKNDDEEAFGVNGEVFIPELNMGIFGRYGIYRNRDLDEEGNTYSFGITFLDLFSKNDRVGLAYGRDLSNEELRQENGDDVPDVLELYYDFQFLPNVRLGFSLQQRNSFKETFAGFRLKTDFDVTPRGRFTP
ncbi:MAG: porin [Moorea sp. SIO2C4]|nr:porin [Moorena sp. SIO2C4]